MWTTEQKVQEYVEKYQMISPGDVVVAGVSGGADSVCLLYLLLSMRQKLDFKILVVHVNHQLRGREADGDQEFVGMLCEEKKLPFYPISRNIREMAERKKLTLEEAGRVARYQAFEEVCHRWGGTKIALAHHQDDQAETMIHHMARGTGLRGLCALKPVSGNRIRPMLCMTREETEQYLLEKGQSWRTDQTNLDDEYTRNKIRHHVIEFLTAQVNPRAVSHMAETSEELGEIQELLEELEKEKRRTKVQREKEGTLLLESLRKEKPVLQRRILLAECKCVAGKNKDFTRVHSEDLLKLWEKQVGKQIFLPYGLTAERTYQGIFIRKKEEKHSSSRENTRFSGQKLNPVGDTKIGEYTISCQVFPKNNQGITEKKYTKWFDYDKIKDSLVLRYRRSGDRISVHPSGGSKKLKDYMIDNKIPRADRDHIPLLADGNHILWVIGHRISESYKVKNETKRIIQIQIKGGTIDE